MSAVVTDLPPIEDPTTGRLRSARAPWLLLAVALLLWLVALPSLPGADVSQFGLLASGSPALLLALLATAAGFLTAVWTRDVRAVLGAAVVAVVVQRLTVTLITEVPSYSWTYKHLGVVDYISGHGHLARGVDVYNGWPGLFASTAWFSDVSGLAPITIAHWFTPALHLALVAAVYVMARAWGSGRLAAASVAYLVEAVNWVGQDYFAPQAIALLLGVVFLAVVGWSRTRAVETGLGLLIYAAIVVSHQLTPYWLILACGLLMVTRRIKPWWLPLVMAAVAGAWFLTNWSVVSQFTLLSFDPTANAKSNIATTGVFGQVVTSQLVRMLSVLLWSAAALAAVLERRAGRPVLAKAILAFSPFLILGGQGYGGEAIFRVFLYAMPGCALLVGPLVVRAVHAGALRLVAASVAVVVAVAASAQGYLGGWFANLMTRDQVEFSAQLLDDADFPAYLMAAAPAWPERPTGRYVEYAKFRLGYDYPMVYAANLAGSSFDSEDDYRKFNKIIAGRTGGPTYLLISSQMKIYDWYFGIVPLGGLDNLAQRMATDPRWKIVASTGDFTVFKTVSFETTGGDS